jgi:signal transduction histidine kinase
VSIIERLDEVIAMNSLAAGEKNIRLKKLVTGRERPIYAAGTDIYLILWNLVHNAIKFTRRSKAGSVVEIIVAFAPEMVTITVKDQGVGIKESDRSQIWDLGFSTADTGGRGLYIVHQLASSLDGGDVQMRSVAGKGSEFSLIIKQGEE